VAAKAFEHIESESKALIIMSDGEEHDEETLQLVSKAHSEGINVYTIGIGTAKGAPIQLSQGLVHDTDGSIVISKLDDSFLKKI
jgi:Ca-activated chloride channel family protein